MARMYSKKKGKSGSTKPVKKTKPNWIRYDKKEIEQLIVKLAKSGKKSSDIGIILRDTYGVPDVRFLVGKKINKILQDNNLQPKLPEDLMALIQKQIKVLKHLEKNKQDKPALRGLQLTVSKINRLIKYYKDSGKLPQDWKYDKDKIGLLLE
ncbi:MAG: 30S ribosomal protein S15 [Candidatus Woesearchaeota archaeon]|nr:30S ribosomal protein S15 [Candidatus Woesearchaeota archaeon]